MRDRLREADVPPAEHPGAVGGVTGALLHECHRRDVPAAVVIVEAHPHLPDQKAARSVAETALDPLAAFEADTTPLAGQADQIQARMQEVAGQYRQAEQADRSGYATSMFQ